MASYAVKVGKTLRNHWKKSTFFTVLTGYGIKYGHDRHEENLLRRVYCAEAKKYGQEKIELDERPRRVTVFLNPAAHGGKARKMFEKTAAPILYLAGLEVNVVKTEYEGQVKKFISVLENGETDAIVVAGGDGTLLETVTGILRKDDKKFHKIPVGVIPLGNTNTFASMFYGVDKEPVRMMADAAMAVVKNITRRVDVLKVDGGEGKTTFALCGMEIGAYRDAEERKSKYWYFGPLKSRWTYIRTAMKTWPPSMKAKVSYVEATPENMTYTEDVDEQPPPKRTLWSFLFRRKDSGIDKERKLKEEERRRMEEEDEKSRVSKELSTVELSLMTSNMDNSKDLLGIHFEMGPSEPTKKELIYEGWDRIKRTEPKYGCDTNERHQVKNVSIELDLPEQQEGPPVWYNIDGESFEAIPVTISLLQKKLQVFCPVFEPCVENS